MCVSEENFFSTYVGYRKMYFFFVVVALLISCEHYQRLSMVDFETDSYRHVAQITKMV